MTSIIPIADIRVPARRRRGLDVASVQRLMDSIREVGLLNPITITKDRMLISGLHRKHACELLGWTEIPVVVVDLGGLKAELAEIDENLVRNDLSKLERSNHVAWRKEIYERLHPETKAKVAGAHASNRAQGKHATAESAVASFVSDTAAKTGVSERTIREDVAIGRDLAPEVINALRGTDVANSKTILLALAKEPVLRQRELVAAGMVAIKAAAAKRAKPSTSPAAAANIPEMPKRIRIFAERAEAISKLEEPRHVRVLLRMAVDCLNAKENELRKLTSEYEEQFVKYTF